MSSRIPSEMKGLLSAIVRDDRAAAKELLRANPNLAACATTKPCLYNSGVFHWLYAGDTAMHLAAAGYRVSIIRLLLAAGADPNRPGPHRGGFPLHYAADGYIIGPAWDPKRQIKTIRVL